MCQAKTLPPPSVPKPVITAPKEIKAPEPKTPKIPDNYMSQLLALVSQQKDILSDEKNLIELYKTDADNMARINMKGMEIEEKMFKELGLDPKKYATQSSKDGFLIIINKDEVKK